jgi:chorismate mutase/prephenate dehydratase
MEIGELRRQIDALDAEIVALLARRAEVALAVGRAKARASQATHAPEREEEVLARIARLNRGPLPEAGLRAVYREIMSACRALEGPLRVAYLGPEATFTHQACLKQFGRSAEAIPARSIPDVFGEVEKGNADYGVVPVENSTEGAVGLTLDRFVETPLVICAEVYLPISHFLLAREAGLDRVKAISSHPQAIGQTRKWIEGHLPGVPVHEVTSTAAAAKRAASEAGVAAIAPELAAERYGLAVLAARIEDSPNNLTRFLVLGRRAAPASPGAGGTKTSALFSIQNRVGALHRLIEPFATHRINLTRIESRPSKQRPWDYFFYLDFDGHQADPEVRAALDELGRKEECVFLKVLGSYPRGTLE